MASAMAWSTASPLAMRASFVAKRGSASRRPSPRALNMASAEAGGEADSADAGALAVRSILAPARDAHHHAPRVLPGERLPAEAPLLERPRHVVLDEDIGVLHELSQEGLSRRRGQVQRDRALAPGVDLPPELAEGLGPGAERIARPGILHLDDVGPETGQHGGE